MRHSSRLLQFLVVTGIFYTEHHRERPMTTKPIDHPSPDLAALIITELLRLRRLDQSHLLLAYSHVTSAAADMYADWDIFLKQFMRSGSTEDDALVQYLYELEDACLELEAVTGTAVALVDDETTNA